MEQHGFIFEADKCVGCKACEIACRERSPHDTGVRSVTTLERGNFPNVEVAHLSMSCQHCGDPMCAAVCPVGAITKRLEDGIVVVDEAKCIGCFSCLTACPFNVPQFNASGKMIKCDLCLDRKEMGLEPACVRSCFYGALHAGSLDELHIEARERLVERLAGATRSMIATST